MQNKTELSEAGRNFIGAFFSFIMECVLVPCVAFLSFSFGTIPAKSMFGADAVAGSMFLGLIAAVLGVRIYNRAFIDKKPTAEPSYSLSESLSVGETEHTYMAEAPTQLEAHDMLEVVINLREQRNAKQEQTPNG